MTLKELRDCAFRSASEIVNGKIFDFRLEQVEKDVNDWDIVISFLVTDINQSEGPIGMLGMSQPTKPYERVFKRMLLDQNGSLIKILMYKG